MVFEIRVIYVFIYFMCSSSSSSFSLPSSYLHSKANYISHSFVPSLSPTFSFSLLIFLSSLFSFHYLFFFHHSHLITYFYFIILTAPHLTLIILVSFSHLNYVRWYKYLHFKSGSKKNLNSILQC